MRLSRGDLDDATVYAADPVSVAEEWEARGARRLHVVDLDGAVSGEPSHRDVITRIVSAVSIPVQVAGGVRTVDALRAWLDAGAARVVTGTAALVDESFLEAALRLAPANLVVALDARDGELRVEGWKQGSGLDVVATAERLGRSGVRRLICTDISRDGMLSGANIDLMGRVADAAGVPVIAAGGVGSTADLQALAALRGRGVEGAIVGRALYTGDLDLREALAVV